MPNSLDGKIVFIWTKIQRHFFKIVPSKLMLNGTNFYWDPIKPWVNLTNSTSKLLFIYQQCKIFVFNYYLSLLKLSCFQVWNKYCLQLTSFSSVSRISITNQSTVRDYPPTMVYHRSIFAKKVTDCRLRHHHDMTKIWKSNKFRCNSVFWRQKFLVWPQLSQFDIPAPRIHEVL